MVSLGFRRKGGRAAALTQRLRGFRANLVGVGGLPCCLQSLCKGQGAPLIASVWWGLCATETPSIPCISNGYLASRGGSQDLAKLLNGKVFQALLVLGVLVCFFARRPVSPGFARISTSCVVPPLRRPSLRGAGLPKVCSGFCGCPKMPVLRRAGS